MKNRYLFLMVLLLMLVSISCTYADDSNGTGILTGTEQSTANGEGITLNEIDQANVDEDILITGKLTDNSGSAIGDSDVNISLTQMPYGETGYVPLTSEVVKTDYAGVYEYSYKPVNGGQLNIMVTAPKNQFTNASIFVAPISTRVSMDTKKVINIGESFNVTGRLTDIDGNPLRYTGVGILVRGTPYGDYNYSQFSKEYARTDEDGYYSYIYTPKLSGRFDISAYFPGYHRYRFNRTDLSVRVIPKATKLIVDPIPDIHRGDNISISGKLVDCDDNPLRYTSVGLLFDGENKTYVRTDENALFNYSYNPMNKDTVLLQVYYPGYHNYAFTQWWEYSSIYDGKLITKPIQNVSYGESVEIFAKAIDFNDKAIKYKDLSIYIEYECGDIYSTASKDIKTDENGIYSYNFTPSAGSYKLYLWSLDERIKEPPASEFNVAGKATNITVNYVKNATDNKRTVIYGRCIDGNDNPIKNGLIEIRINVKNQSVVSFESKKVHTDSDGNYSLDYPNSYSDIYYVDAWYYNEFFEYVEAIAY